MFVKRDGDRIYDIKDGLIGYSLEAIPRMGSLSLVLGSGSAIFGIGPNQNDMSKDKLS